MKFEVGQKVTIRTMHDDTVLAKVLDHNENTSFDPADYSMMADYSLIEVTSRNRGPQYPRGHRAIVSNTFLEVR